MPSTIERRAVRYTVLSFDLDGTLVDTADEIAEAANRTIEEFGVPRRPPAEILLLIGAGTRELMTRLVAGVTRELSLPATQLPLGDVLARFDVHYAATAGISGLPYPGCADTLQRLRDAGVRLACVTNKEERFARRVLEATRLDGAFELLIGGDTLPVKKPDRGVIDHVLGALGGQAGTAAHIGDSRTDVQTARNAGVGAWAVPYGYNAGEAIEACRPERIFHSLPEIADHVLAANRLESAGLGR